MPSNGDATVMDDVDRLFECFKCGISPPPSAARERKRSKSKLKLGGPKHGVSASSNNQSPGSGHGQNNSTVEISPENLGSSTTKVKELNRGKQISPIVFYGTPRGVPPKKPLSLLRLLCEIRNDLSEHSNSNVSKEVWATFPRQNEAMNFAKGHSDSRIFSYQNHYNGRRRFLVSTYKEFWWRYKIMDPKFRHHYEVIQEGLPCHLYFDLEFNKRDNAQKNGEEMVDILISVILKALFDKYSIEGNDDWIVELDSTTEEKFSRHLIIRIPKIAFKNNSHAGAFVTEICSRIISAREKDARFDKLFVKKDPSSAQTQLFVDTAVYSRNRCFRLALSSKAGKTSVLLPTGRFKCKDMSEGDMFMASLICNMDVDCETLLVCKMELDCIKTLRFDTKVYSDFVLFHFFELPCSRIYYFSCFRRSFCFMHQHIMDSREKFFLMQVHNNSRQCFTISQEYASYACSSDMSTTHSTGRSPFPALEKFVECIASDENLPGKIRSWYWFSESGLIVYSMLRNRYCERIGRQHKSNHVMYVVDLTRAVFYQKCHDPDCAGYRSPLRPIPMDTIPDNLFSSGPGEMARHGDLSHDGIKYQLVDNFGEHDSLYNDEQSTWWVEAIKVADDIEKKQQTLQPGDEMVIEDEDDEWWMAAERTAALAEQMHSSNQVTEQIDGKCLNSYSVGNTEVL